MTALALCRFAHILAAMLVFGASAFLWLDAPDDLRRALTAKLRSFQTAAAFLALATAALWLALQTAAIADDGSAATDPAALSAILFDTGFGRASALRLALTAALALAVSRSGGAPPRSAVLSALVLASLALVGHAVLQTGPLGLLHRANHALHLLCAGAWVGGLIPFVLSLAAGRRGALRHSAVAAMTRFSLSGHFVVAALVATGLVDVALTSGFDLLPPGTAYREWLDLKIGVVAGMIALALVNRYALVPHLRTRAKAYAGLIALSLVNVALGTLVVALSSVVAGLDPA